MNWLKRFWIVLLALAGMFSWAGCSHHRDRIYETHTTVYHDNAGYVVEPPATGASYQYYYYPDEEVYFVPSERVYWWREGGEWHSGREVPHGIHLRGHVVLNESEAEPWRHHEIIVEKYPRHKHDADDEHRHRDKDDD